MLIASTGCSDIGAAAPSKGNCSVAYPQLSGRVVDQDNLLTPEREAKLTASLAELETRTKHQMVVAIVSSLHGEVIENYSLCLANHWVIGRQSINDGVLLLVAPHERKVRIEVGYGLEAMLTDDEAAQILRDDILPKFKQGLMPEGIFAGTDAILSEIGLPRDTAT